MSRMISACIAGIVHRASHKQGVGPHLPLAHPAHLSVMLCSHLPPSAARSSTPPSECSATAPWRRDTANERRPGGAGGGRGRGLTAKRQSGKRQRNQQGEGEGGRRGNGNGQIGRCCRLCKAGN